MVVETASLEIDVAVELADDRLQIDLNLVKREHLAGGRFSGGIANHGGATASQGDRSVSEALNRAQQHDAEQVPDVKRCRRGIETDVGGDGTGGKCLGQAAFIGDVLDISARAQV